MSPEAAAALAAAPQVMAGLSALSRIAAQAPPSAGGTVPTAAPGDLPNLDPLMALGANSPLFNMLAQWQRIDLPAAIADAAPRSNDGAKVAVPQNLVPYIRLAIADQLEHETDRISMDVIAMLFDYVFRDPSIPDRLRELFGRLQVPVVKVGLLDRAFFSDRAHPARKLLDHLAAAAIGATGDARYYESFRRLALSIIDDLCFRFEIDVAVFARGRPQAHRVHRVRAPQHRDRGRPGRGRGAARSRRAKRTAPPSAVSIRDKLSGIEVPFEVRSFLETTWVDHLARAAQARGRRRARRSRARTRSSTTCCGASRRRSGPRRRRA